MKTTFYSRLRRWVLGMVLSALFITLLSPLPKAEANAPLRLWISDARMAAIERALDARREPQHTAYKQLLQECEKAVWGEPSPPTTFFVPPYYTDREGHSAAKKALKRDANAAYALALCYRLDGSDVFGRAAVRIIQRWSTTLTQIDSRADSTLVFSYHFPAMVFAADLLRGTPLFTAAHDSAFTQFLHTVAAKGSSIGRVSHSGCGFRPGDTLTNNWSNWGVVLTLAIGIYTRDAATMQQALQVWRRNVSVQVDAQGNLPIEGRRNSCEGNAGLHYTHYAMQPLAIAAEIACATGTNLVNDPKVGATYQRAIRRTAEVSRFPQQFSYHRYDPDAVKHLRYKVAWLELASNQVKDDHASWLLRQFRPVTTAEVIRYATLTHGDLPSACGAAQPDQPPLPPAEPSHQVTLRGVAEGEVLRGRVVVEGRVAATDVERMEFQIDGPRDHRHIEYGAPFTLFGGLDGVPHGWDTTTFPDGTYTLTVTAIDRRGQQLARLVRFSIANTSAPEPQPIELVGVAEGQVLRGQAVIEAYLLEEDAIKQVTFRLDGPRSNTQVEYGSPFSLFGGMDGVPHVWDTTDWPDGAYTLTVTACGEQGACDELQRRFRIDNTSAVEATATRTPTAEATATATATQERD